MVSLIVGTVDIPINLLDTMAMNNLQALLPRDLACCSWLIVYGHYPVNTGHLMGHPQFAGPDHVAQGYDKPDGFDGWHSIKDDKLCFTGQFGNRRAGRWRGHVTPALR